MRPATARRAGASAVLTRASRAFAILACAALTNVACDAGGAPPAPAPGAPSAAGPEQVVRDAAAATVQAGSARTTVVAETPAGPVRATGPVRFSPFAADLSATVGSREIPLRSVDGTSWARFGSRWQQLSPGLLPVGAVGGVLRAASGLSPVTEVGPEQIGGVPATHYRGTVDLAAVPAPDPTARAELDELSALASPTPDVEVWVGPDGRIAQLRTVSAPAPGTQAASAPTPSAVTVTLTEPGIPVEVAPPTTG